MNGIFEKNKKKESQKERIEEKTNMEMLKKKRERREKI